jgi:osmotically-inducible protein OsmY
MAAIDSPFARNSLLISAVLFALALSARAQSPARVDDRPPREMPPRAIEAAIYLELYGHPDTARHRIEVRAVFDRVELSGVVSTDAARRTAEQLAGLVAPNRRIVNRLEVERDPQRSRTNGSAEGTPEDLARQFTDALAAKFPPEIMREVTVTTYLVGEPSVWVVALEGVVPSVRDQLAMSETLIFGSPSAAAVVNRTYAARNHLIGSRPDVSIRVPFVGLDVDVDRGVDLDVGPLGLRIGGGSRYRIADDPRLLDEFMAAVQADGDLRNAEIRPHMFAGVLMLDGRLQPAEKMRVVALATGLRGIRGVVDRTETMEGGPAYYRESDLAAYLRYRLGEHAGAREVELQPAPKDRIKVAATVATEFQATLAAAVLANDPAVGDLAVEPTFREATPDLPK